MKNATGIYEAINVTGLICFVCDQVFYSDGTEVS